MDRDNRLVKYNRIRPCGLCCIKVNNLGVNFGGQEVLHDVNMHIHCGTITSIIGKNGAGKSTFVRALLGEVKHTGSIEFRDVEDGKVRGLRIGYVPQNLNIDKTTPMSVYDLFASFCFKLPVFIKGRKTYNKVLEALKVFEAEELIDKPVGTLSGGQLQRVLLSMAIYDMPKLLILDEPVSGIDNNGMQLFYDKMLYLKEHYDMAILIVSHDLEYVYRYSDSVYLVDSTVVASGKAKDVFMTKEFDKTFGGFKLEEAKESVLGNVHSQSEPVVEVPFDASYRGGKHE